MLEPVHLNARADECSTATVEHGQRVMRYQGEEYVIIGLYFRGWNVLRPDWQRSTFQPAAFCRSVYRRSGGRPLDFMIIPGWVLSPVRSRVRDHTRFAGAAYAGAGSSECA